MMFTETDRQRFKHDLATLASTMAELAQLLERVSSTTEREERSRLLRDIEQEARSLKSHWEELRQTRFVFQPSHEDLWRPRGHELLETPMIFARPTFEAEIRQLLDMAADLLAPPHTHSARPSDD